MSTTITITLPVVPPISDTPYISDDTLDPRHGQPLGTQYRCDGVVAFVPAATAPDCRADVLMLDRDFLLVELVAVLPALLVLLADPRVQAAYAGASAVAVELVEPDTFARALTALLDTMYDRGYTEGRASAVEPDAPGAPGAPASTVELDQWGSDTDGTPYTDYVAGTGLTQVRIGSLGLEKPGIELIIGRYCLNEQLSAVVTLADVRALRDNLNALLADPRVQALAGDSEGSEGPR